MVKVYSKSSVQVSYLGCKIFGEQIYCVITEGPIRHEPQFDAGGMLDNNPHFHPKLVSYIEDKV